MTRKLDLILWVTVAIGLLPNSYKKT